MAAKLVLNFLNFCGISFCSGNVVKAVQMTERRSCVGEWSGEFLSLTSNALLVLSLLFMLKNCTCCKSSVLLHLKAIESCFLHFLYLIIPIQESTVLPG